MLPLVVRDARGSDMKHRIQTIRDDLAVRTSYEQSNIVEVLKIWENEKVSADLAAREGRIAAQPLFNTYLNILSHSNDAGSANPPFFKHLDIDLERYEADKSSQPSASPPEELRKGRINLSPTALYIDIVLNEESNTLDLHARSSGGLMTTSQLRIWLSELSTEISSLTTQIEHTM